MASNSSNFLLAEAQLILDEARKVKSEKTKNLGEPIQLPGKALGIAVRGEHAWVAENTAVARKINLETGKSVQIFRGHTGPVTCLAFCDKVDGSGDEKILITGSWDMKIKLWDTDTMHLISSTEAHTDFVKSLLVLPSLHLLISGGSDKIVRFWDLSSLIARKPLTGIGSISSHTRPVECLEGIATSDSSAIVFTGDTMGLIKVWDLTKDSNEPPHWQSSADDTVQLTYNKTTWADATCTILPPIKHPVAVRAILPLHITDACEPFLVTGAGDIIRVYDISEIYKPELVGQIDAHWHDITAIRLWLRKSIGIDKRSSIELWIISASLDGTIRKWKLSDVLYPPSEPTETEKRPNKPPHPLELTLDLTEEEEMEIAELLEND